MYGPGFETEGSVWFRVECVKSWLKFVVQGRGVIEHKHREDFLSNFSGQLFRMAQGQKICSEKLLRVLRSPFVGAYSQQPPSYSFMFRVKPQGLGVEGAGSWV